MFQVMVEYFEWKVLKADLSITSCNRDPKEAPTICKMSKVFANL